MDLGAYFQTMEYVLMTSTFIALVLIFLYMFHGKEDEETSEKTWSLDSRIPSSHQHKNYNHYDRNYYAYQN